MSIALQFCRRCGAPQYPRRHVCRVCLSDQLGIDEVAADADLLAIAQLRTSLEPAFANALPLWIGTVMLDAGVRAIVIVDDGLLPGTRVTLHGTMNVLGQTVWRASAAEHRLDGAE